MPAEVVFVGYTCPACGSRVAVLRSTHPPKYADEILAVCKCGHLRRIALEEIQSLEVWKEKASGEQ